LVKRALHQIPFERLLQKAVNVFAMGVVDAVMVQRRGQHHHRDRPQIRVGLDGLKHLMPGMFRSSKMASGGRDAVIRANASAPSQARSIVTSISLSNRNLVIRSA
jgi:hypothetical protein